MKKINWNLNQQKHHEIYRIENKITQIHLYEM